MRRIGAAIAVLSLGFVLEEFIGGSAEAREICERPGFAPIYSKEFSDHLSTLVG